MSRIPNLFIVGAPKCGTTALWTYLGSHPDIFVAGKEYHFFGSDLPYHGARPRLSTEAYLDRFAEATSERYRGEASVGYLYSELAAREIHAFSPDARIVAILRNPVDMIHSLHSEELFQGDEDIPGFAEALAAEEGRRRGEGIPDACEALWPLFYRAVGRYASQVARYLDVFGPDRVHVIISEEFRADTAAGYRDVLQFLGVDPGFRPEFPVVNANKVPRSTTAVRLLRRPPPVVRRFARMVLPTPASRRSMGRRLQALNVDQRPREAMPPELRRSLESEFADDVARLSELLGRDLKAWRPSPA